MHTLTKRTLEFIHRQRLLRPDETVIVGLSGGPDSVALCLLLRELNSSGELPLQLIPAHLNHMLRGAESDGEEEFCRQFANEHSLPIEVNRVEVDRQASESNQSIEEAAREARYQFLAEVARKHEATKIATGHHGDDVAETVLMRLIRGCGLHGLGAFEASRQLQESDPDLRLVRPLLLCSRQDILDFLAARGHRFKRDSSNRDEGFLRNRIRHELIPLLQREYHGFSVQSLCALNRSAVEVNELLGGLVDRRWGELCVEKTAHSLSLDVEVFGDLTAAERKAAIRKAVAEVGTYEGSTPPLKALHYEQVDDLTERKVGSAVSLPDDIVARREHGVIYFDAPHEATVPSQKELQVGGEVRWPAADLTITAEVLPADSISPRKAACQAGPHRVFLSRDALSEPLYIRARRPGDVFHPLGAPGSKKLKDFLIDRKVPRHKRDALPLIVTADDEIVWVVGVEIAEASRLTGRENEVLALSAQ